MVRQQAKVVGRQRLRPALSQTEVNKRLAGVEDWRSQRLRDALTDARRVQRGLMTLAEWKSKHYDVRQKRGRRAGRAPSRR